MASANEVFTMEVQERLETNQITHDSATIKYLGPEDFVLFKGPGGGLRMTLARERSVLRIKAKRCFPFTFPAKYISIRDGNDEEIGIIADLSELSKEYRHWIEEDLEIRYFTPLVKSIGLIRHRFGGVEWHVDTDCGPKRLITKSVHDTMTEVEIGRYVITDVDGNRYEIFANDLDEASAARLHRLI